MHGVGLKSSARMRRTIKSPGTGAQLPLRGRVPTIYLKMYQNDPRDQNALDSNLSSSEPIGLKF